jgi:hypothetical protein
MKIPFLVAFIFFCSIQLFSQNITRGPYLQQPTDNAITLMWRTDIPTNTYVWYGNSPTNLTQNVGINNSATDHEFIVSGLSPYTKYYYAVGTSSGMLSTPDSNHFFRTHPISGTQQPIHVWAIGDFGKGNTGQLNVKNSYTNYVANNNLNTDVWMWLGDNAYNDGTDSDYQTKVFGYAGFNDIFSYMPFYPSPGNHDYNTVWSESVFLGIPYSNIALEDHVGPYYNIVDVPENAEAGGVASQLEVFYSFDYGNVHFLSLNSEVYDFANTMDGINQMKAWITQDLQANDKTFTIAYFHQPPYSKGSHDSDDAFELVMKTMREDILPLLESFDIDLVVCGHSHVYERSYLINGHYGLTGDFVPATMIKDVTDGNFANGNPYMKDTIKTNNEGTIYVVCGNGGSSETAPDLDHPAMTYSEGNSSAYGSFMMDIYRNRLDGKYLSVDGTIHDEFTILKKNLNVNDILDVTICEGDSILIEASWSGGSDDLQFVWSNISTDTSAQFIQPTISGSYQLEVTDLLTGQIESETFQINLTNLPTPVITISNDTLFVQSGYNYQWYLDGNIIPGATNDFLVVTNDGNYTVEIINGICTQISSPFFFAPSSISNIEKENAKIYPNPALDQFYIELNDISKLKSISIYDISGNLMKIINEKSQKTTINTTEFASGIYFIECEYESIQYYYKLVIEK